MAAGYEAFLRAQGLDSLEALFALRNDQRLGKTGLAPWRERLRVECAKGGKTRTLYLKRFRRPPRSARREVRRCGGGARSVAGMEWTWMRRLAADGIPCAKPVAFGEEVRRGRELRSAVLIEAVEGVSLEEALAAWPEGNRAKLAALRRPLASIVARLHDRGYAHRDLYLSHVFWDSAAPSDRSLRLIDLQRVRRTRSRLSRWVVKDLAALNYSTPSGLVSTRDRVRWLKEYLGEDKLSAAQRIVLYRIVGKTQQIAGHNRRRRARLRGENR